MALLDQVVGCIMGGAGGVSPLQGVLMNMLGDGQQGLSMLCQGPRTSVAAWPA